MASTTMPRRTRRGDGTGSGRAPQTPMLVPSSGRQRRWSLALIAVLVTVGSALAFVVLWMNAGDRKPVLAMARDVAAGQIIESSDLTVVRVAVDQVIRPVPASSRDDVIGEPASVDLRAGTILVAGHLGDDNGLETGTAVVAVPVPVDELPAPDLQPGDRLLIYVTGAPGSDEADSAEQIGEGRIFAVDEEDDALNTLRVSITVDENLVPTVAGAIQADRIYLALASN